MSLSTANPETMPQSMSLEERVARLQALLEASRLVHSTIAVDEVLLQTAKVLVRELELEGAVFLQPDSDVRMASYGSVPDVPGESCHRFDLLAKDGLPLAELVVTTAEGCRLSQDQADFIEGLTLQASAALENAMLHERDVQWARVQQDLEAARSIQRSLLPRRMPVIAGVSVAARTVTCYEVGGDYLDLVELPDGSHLFVVADVAGKGLASAVVSMSFRSAFRGIAALPIPLVEMVNRVGQHHWEEGQEARRRYVTAIFVRLTPDGGLLEIVNAGHNPAALLGADGANGANGSLHMIEASGVPLGMLPGMSYTATEWAFPPGARLLLYTDGLTEVFRGEEEFGPERLVEAFQALRTCDAEESLEALWTQLQQFSTGGPQTDDMTALALIHQPTGHGNCHGEDAGG